jgi:hypothetical protein
MCHDGSGTVSTHWEYVFAHFFVIMSLMAINICGSPIVLVLILFYSVPDYGLDNLSNCKGATGALQVCVIGCKLIVVDHFLQSVYGSCHSNHDYREAVCLGEYEMIFWAIMWSP